MSDEIETIVFFMDENVRRNYTLGEIADKVAELALEKVLEKLKEGP